MKYSLIGLALVAGMAGPAEAACYADYKAKRDDPLRLHYGVVELDELACSNRDEARSDVQRRLKPEGWKLLTIISIFDESSLDARRSDAGSFFLRY